MHYDCGIAIIVSPEVSTEAYRLVSEIERRGVALVSKLDAAHVPHITVYQGRFFDKKRAHEAWKKLIMPTLRSIVVRMSNEVEVRPSGNIFWNVLPNKELAALHVTIASAMQAYSDGLFLDQSTKALESANDTERERITRFGVRASGEYFHPHVTLARLSHHGEAKLITVSPEVKSFSVTNLFFGPINAYGQMQRPDSLRVRFEQ